MKAELLKEMIEKTKAIIAAPSCNPETKAACERWLASVDTDKFEAETKVYMDELAEAVVPIDGLIAFAGSEGAKGYFGEEGAANLLKHAQEIKTHGAKFCDCAACTPAVEILEKKAEILG